MMKTPSTPKRSAKNLVHHLALTCALTVIPSLGYAQPADFTPFEVEYNVGNNTISAGSATLKLAKQGDEWVYSLKTKPTGVFKLTGKGKIQEVSVFSIVESSEKLELQPQKYSYRQDSEARRSVDAWFDWNENQLTYKRRGKEVTQDFSDPILDRLSVTLAIMDELKKKNFKEIELKVFDSGRVRSMLFVNEGTEIVKSRMGPLETIRVRSKAMTGSTRHTTTWFAPSLDYVPVKIEQYKKDKLVARLTLTKLHNRITDAGGAVEYKENEKE